MIPWNTIIFFFIILLLMAFFAGIEMAFYSANRMSFELKKKQGGRATQIVSKFIDSPAKFWVLLLWFSYLSCFLILQLSTVMRPAWEYIGVQAFSGHDL
ncbi:MAG: DUF21 domain-containing protein [Chitinophagaceae bacterium]|nr:DUF21 domain-containing protein [Chitinophagaceae bacterium]